MISFTAHRLFYTTIYHMTPNRGLNNAVRKVSQSEKFYSDDDDDRGGCCKKTVAFPEQRLKLSISTVFFVLNNPRRGAHL